MTSFMQLARSLLATIRSQVRSPSSAKFTSVTFKLQKFTQLFLQRSVNEYLRLLGANLQRIRVSTRKNIKDSCLLLGHLTLLNTTETREKC